MTTNAVFPLYRAMDHQKMLKFRHCVDTIKVRRRRTKAYLRLRPTFQWATMPAESIVSHSNGMNRIHGHMSTDE